MHFSLLVFLILNSSIKKESLYFTLTFPIFSFFSKISTCTYFYTLPFLLLKLWVFVKFATPPNYKNQNLLRKKRNIAVAIVRK